MDQHIGYQLTDINKTDFFKTGFIFGQLIITVIRQYRKSRLCHTEIFADGYHVINTVVYQIFIYNRILPAILYTVEIDLKIKKSRIGF